MRAVALRPEGRSIHSFTQVSGRDMLREVLFIGVREAMRLEPRQDTVIISILDQFEEHNRPGHLHKFRDHQVLNFVDTFERPTKCMRSPLNAASKSAQPAAHYHRQRHASRKSHGSSRLCDRRRAIHTVGQRAVEHQLRMPLREAAQRGHVPQRNRHGDLDAAAWPARKAQRRMRSNSKSFCRADSSGRLLRILWRVEPR